MGKILYVAVTPDEYELPLRVETTGSKMAEWADMRLCHLYTYIKRGIIYKKTNCKFIKVGLDNGEDL